MSNFPLMTVATILGSFSLWLASLQNELPAKWAVPVGGAVFITGAIARLLLMLQKPDPELPEDEVNVLRGVDPEDDEAVNIELGVTEPSA